MEVDVNAVYVLYNLYTILCSVLYRAVGNWWYKRKGGNSTRKKKSKMKNKIFSFEALFSRKSTLNFARYACTLSRLVITDLTVDRCLDGYYRSLSLFLP